MKVYFGIGRDGVIFLQYPTGRIQEFTNLAKRRGNKVVIIVHDLDILRNMAGEKEIEVLNAADLLIVHTPAMREYLKKKGIGREYVVLECFDYLYGSTVKIPEVAGEYKVAFTGNLTKSKFLDRVNLKNAKLHLYGIGIETRKLNNGVEYKGCFPPEQLADNMSEHFGLVWDGESPDTCAGQFGEYLKVNAPHKFSMYLSAGLPVIVWKESALAPFVGKNNIGLVVSSLSEMDERLGSISSEEYGRLLTNVSKIQKKMLSGGFLKEALKRSSEIVKADI
ncbi:MAG: hypothetical protein K2J70_02910 [Muribaculaceae bacterium]|nr:hypothetical protein [Muribaculaceae bacterium]